MLLMPKKIYPRERLVLNGWSLGGRVVHPEDPQVSGLSVDSFFRADGAYDPPRETSFEPDFRPFKEVPPPPPPPPDDVIRRFP